MMYVLLTHDAQLLIIQSVSSTWKAWHNKDTYTGLVSAPFSWNLVEPAAPYCRESGKVAMQYPWLP